jgi:hypothetical protein
MNILVWLRERTAGGYTARGICHGHRVWLVSIDLLEGLWKVTARPHWADWMKERPGALPWAG